MISVKPTSNIGRQTFFDESAFSASGFPLVVFGVLPLPDWVGVDRQLADLLKPLHKWLALSLAALVLVHVAAALKHHLVDRDGLLKRMRPAF